MNSINIIWNNTWQKLQILHVSSDLILSLKLNPDAVTTPCPYLKLRWYLKLSSTGKWDETLTLLLLHLSWESRNLNFLNEVQFNLKLSIATYQLFSFAKIFVWTTHVCTPLEKPTVLFMHDKTERKNVTARGFWIPCVSVFTWKSQWSDRAEDEMTTYYFKRF